MVAASGLLDIHNVFWTFPVHSQLSSEELPTASQKNSTTTCENFQEVFEPASRSVCPRFGNVPRGEVSAEPF